MSANKKRSLIILTITFILASLITLAASQAGAIRHGYSVFLICAVAAFVIQWLAFVPAYLFQTEKILMTLRVASPTYLSR